MKFNLQKRLIYIFLLSAGTFQMYAETGTSSETRLDTVAKSYTLNEVSVIGIKEQASIEKLPASVSRIEGDELDKREIVSLNNLTSIVPGFYMPGYGSKITSSIFIRGIGTRMNEPAVGLYVDNVPYLDKSAFDFDWFDLSEIDILRGPQGTLYGRNSMAGIININTVSPLLYQGTKVSVSYGNENTARANVAHYGKMNDNAGFYVGLNYNQTDGFFTNVYTGKKADDLKSGGGRFRLDMNVSDRLMMNYALSYEYSDQNGFPYKAYDKSSETASDVNYNNPCSYERSLLTNSLYFSYKGNKFIASSTTSHQYFDDKMLLDQDFSPANIFTLDQRQTQNAFTEEIVFKSNTRHKYQWLFGAFGFYQFLNTRVPVEFKRDGMNSIFAGLKEGNPKMPLLTLKSDSVLVDGIYKTPRSGAAVFHQSTVNNMFTKGLSLTLGVRFDYERVRLNYFSNTSYADVVATMGPMVIPAPILPDTISGKESMSFAEFLPKATLKYEFNKTDMIYVSAAKGYKAGGYNIQLFADIMQSRMMTMGGQSKNPSEDKINGLIAYKPEYSRNYEVGGRASLIQNKLSADASLFYIDCKNMQIVQSSESMGRMMKNAGKAVSCGVEASLTGLFGNFRTNIAYGFTHATFKQYTDSLKNDDGNTYRQVDYKGNYAPMAPEHTFAATIDYTFDLKTRLIEKLIIGAYYSGAGKIYWTAANDAVQDFYGLLDGKISLVKGICKLDFWVKNALDTDYKTFYFESMGNSFVQSGRPLQIGTNFTMRF